MKLLLILIASLFIISNSAYAFDNSEVLLPAENQVYSNMTIERLSPNVQTSWDSFRAKNGNWSVLFNEATGTPHYAFGKPIRIAGYENISSDNIEEASMAFVRQNANILGVNPDNLELRRISFVRNRWYVSYSQVYNGLEVLFSEVELRIFGNGNVMAFGSDYYKDIAISTTPIISLDDAIQFASKGIADVSNKGIKVQSAAKTYILPVRNNSEVSYRLVYETTITTDRPDEKYKTFVDAASGDVVWRYNMVNKGTIKVSAQGGIKPNSPLDQPESRMFANMDINIDGKQYTTDDKGVFDVDIFSSSQVLAKLSGPWVSVTYPDGTNAQFNGTIPPDDPPNEDFELIWDDSNSSTLERNVYYYGNFIRDYVKAIDPDITILDQQIDFEIYNQSQFGGPNAFFTGEKIAFVGVADQSVRMADGPSVLFHEYGHLVNGFLYTELGQPNGMINGAANEGTADVQSCLILDNPKVGIGVFKNDPNKIIRNIDNTFTYPEDQVAASHETGLILAGAFWDLRQATSNQLTAELFHFARYGTPDDINNGIAFSEWFIEVLIADDDDGDLSNGTPNYYAIVESFNKHKIGTNLFMELSFSHTPIEDTDDTQNPYLADFTLSASALPGAKPKNFTLVYTINNSGDEIEVPVTETSVDYFSSAIPAQPNGTFIEYYFKADDPFTGDEMFFDGNELSFEPYIFLVGYSSYQKDNFEYIGDWQISGLPQNGDWEQGDPVKAAIATSPTTELVIQPGDDHSEDNSKCFVTGNVSDYSKGMVMGETILTSPVYDIFGLNNPVVRFYLWTTNMQFIQIAGETNVKIEVSGDGGNSWRLVAKNEEDYQDWKLIQFRISDYVDLSTMFRLRLTANNTRPYTILDVLFDDFEILRGKKANSVEPNSLPGIELTNYPNPASGKTTFRLSAEQPDFIKLKIYNLMGVEIATIFEGYIQPGQKDIEWPLVDGQGNTVASGMYFYRLSTPAGMMTNQLIIR